MKTILNLITAAIMLMSVACCWAIERIDGNLRYNDNVLLGAVVSSALPQNFLVPSSYKWHYDDNPAEVFTQKVTAIQGSKWDGTPAFKGCPVFKRVEISSSIEEIGDEAFAGCSKLETLVIHNGNSVGINAFKGCSSLKSVTISQTGGECFLGIGAFADCKTLSELTLPNVPVYFNYDVFDGCKCLTVINIPKALGGVVNGFKNNVYVTDINILHPSEQLKSIDGMICSRLASGLNETWVVDMCPRGRSGHVLLEESVTQIGGDSFNGCSLIQSLTLGSKFETIYGCALGRMSALENLYISRTDAVVGGYYWSFSDYYEQNLNNLPIFTNCTVWVPENMITFYKQHEIWKRFRNIKVWDPSSAGVDTPKVENAEVQADIEEPVEYFNLQGIPVANPSGGVFIRRRGDRIEKVRL